MMGLHRKRFAPGWKLSLAFFLLLLVTFRLGVWQMDRAVYKEALYDGYLNSLTRIAVSPVGGTELLPFTRVRLKGRYRDEVFLVDNRVVAGQTGYWVVSVFDTAQGRYLVNRGFVPAGADRAQLPGVSTPTDEVVLEGVAWPFTGLPPLLSEDPWPEAWPVRVQRLDVERMAERVGAEPVEVRLDGGQAGVETPAPTSRVLDAARHRGYAATWFGLSLVLVIGYGVLAFRRGESKEVT